MVPIGSYRELELKAVVPDAADLRRRMVAAGAILLLRGVMEDRRYDRVAELTARDEVLRTRWIVPEHGDQQAILGWKGPTQISPEGYKLREELEYQLEGGVPADQLLVALGYSVVHHIHRQIEMYRLGNTTIRLEQYPEMDVLVEIEGDPAGIEHAIAASGIPRDQFLADSLVEFVARYERRTGKRARVGRES